MFHAQIIFSGRVQGVGFRGRIRDIAMSEGILGTVENMPDGTVRVHAECQSHERLDAFMEKAGKSGSAFSPMRVDSARVVEFYEKAESGYSSFEIIH